MLDCARGRMTFQRELAWRQLDLVHRSSVSYQFARYALGLSYDSLPQDVIHQAKRCLLDALGCAVGAYDAPGRAICEDVVRELGGPEEATVIGSGMRTSAIHATLVNSFMVRFLDYNDKGGGGHNSDSIPALLAIAERQRAGGRDFLTSLVISYELGARVSESITGATTEERGWQTDMRGGLSMPPALGKLMGLNEDQIAHAVGSCACASLPLNVLDSDREEYTMRKNLRFGWVACDAILSCLLARKGFTGPVRVVEGDGGWQQVLLHGDMDLERITDFSGWRILDTRHKYLCANFTTHGHLFATLAIVKKHDLKPEDIASVRIRTGAREARHTVTPAKKYPRNAESADHSAFYTTALAIKERAFGPDSFAEEKFTDPVILDLIERITVEADPTIPERSCAGKSEITTKDGRVLEEHVVTPHGLGDDPLSDKELEDKFSEMAAKRMKARQVRRILDTIWSAERVDDMGRLMDLIVFPSR